MQTNLEKYLHSKGISVVMEKRHGRGKIISKCPWCEKESSKDNEHCGITTNGEMTYVHCFVCGESGGLGKLKKHYGDWKAEQDDGDIHILRDEAGKQVATWTGPSSDEEEIIEHTMRTPKGLIERSVDFLFRDHHVPKLALDYLTLNRQFSAETLRHWKIGLVMRGKCADDNCGFYGVVSSEKKCVKCGADIRGMRMYISVPFFDQDGELQNLKYRSVPPADKSFERETGGATILYGLGSVDLTKTVIITEAELDALAVWQLGFKNVISLGGSTNWSDEWRAKFVSCPEIYICMDSDKPGRKAASRIASSLGKFRCKIVFLPDGVKDAAEFLEVGGTIDEFRNIAKNSMLATAPIWLKANDIFPELQQIIDMGEEAKGISTMWRDVDKLIGGIRMQELSIITSDTGSGKSVWTNELAMNMARQDVPAAVCSFEIQPKGTLMRSLSQVSRKSYWELVGDNSKQLLQISLGMLNDMPLYFLGINGEVPIDKLLGMLRWGIVKFGLKFIVLDHLHYFLPGMGSRNERFLIDMAARKLNQSCKDWDVHEALVVHPSKHGDGKPWGVRTGPNDLKGSSGLKQEAHNVFSVYRPRGLEASMKASGIRGKSAAEIRLWKTRSQLAEEGVTWLGFDRGGLNYTDLDRPAQKEYARIDADAIGRLRMNQEAKPDPYLQSPEEFQEITKQAELGFQDDPFITATT